MHLTPEQEAQVRRQLEAHKHDNYTVDIELAPGFVLEDFRVHGDVFRPDVTASVYLARWLFFNNGDYRGKNVFDIGCGTGIQGIVAAKYGAMHVSCYDTSSRAVQNARDNAEHFGLEWLMDFEERDLFTQWPCAQRISLEIPRHYVIFNHPFFPEEPTAHEWREERVAPAMLGGEKLIHRFLDAVQNDAAPDLKIIMSFFHLAGDTNNPAVQAPKHGYKVAERFRVELTQGLQKGQFSIYELSR